jgi:hypothetical protein
MIALMELFIAFKKRNLKIKRDDEVFIPARSMQELVREYAPFRDACFQMKGWRSYGPGTCDLVTGYTEAFDALFIRLVQLQQYRLYVVTKEFPKSDHNYELIGNVEPGAPTVNYKQTEGSARHYIWLQNLTREDKSQIYSGMRDFDIVGCFPNIFWNELLKGMSPNPHMVMMVKDPEGFLELCMRDDVYRKLYPRGEETGRDAAKVARSRLFHPPKSGRRPRRSGVDWYDGLSDEIIDTLKRSGISNPHLFFTSIEQRIIDVAIDGMGAQFVALRMHDGFIVKDITDAENLLACLECWTGYKWSSKLI